MRVRSCRLIRALTGEAAQNSQDLVLDVLTVDRRARADIDDAAVQMAYEYQAGGQALASGHGMTGGWEANPRPARSCSQRRSSATLP
jgi:hypothetical protein